MFDKKVITALTDYNSHNTKEKWRKKFRLGQRNEGLLFLSVYRSYAFSRLSFHSSPDLKDLSSI